jgi:hypothetical protein
VGAVTTDAVLESGEPFRGALWLVRGGHRGGTREGDEEVLAGVEARWRRERVEREVDRGRRSSTKSKERDERRKSDEKEEEEEEVGFHESSPLFLASRTLGSLRRARCIDWRSESSLHPRANEYIVKTTSTCKLSENRPSTTPQSSVRLFGTTQTTSKAREAEAAAKKPLGSDENESGNDDDGVITTSERLSLLRY